MMRDARCLDAQLIPLVNDIFRERRPDEPRTKSAVADDLDEMSKLRQLSRTVTDGFAHIHGKQSRESFSRRNFRDVQLELP